MTLDVSDRASFAAFLDEVQDRLGPIDVRANNAVIMPVGSFLHFDDAPIRRTFEIPSKLISSVSSPEVSLPHNG